ncbi:stage II sporulation protein P [Chengkuizengella axinellae]|uniref:Stage II sporulation protein P n=1 Tax=Chengkuizengella axinellae TaxID=3064388 RepID=A0ABT9IUR6_9BACL|nr:stage II sporulation protein P [Chengkuizengella sp. 2205SS18-9]MDP5273057.1 stage II sporulation protein P [Chengkuizengella sp. 2205SS18-9]
MNHPTIIGVMLNVFSKLCIGTFVVYIILSLGSFTQTKIPASSIASMKELGSSVSSSFFMDLIAIEIPQMKNELNQSTFSQKKLFHLTLKYVASINPNDPRSLLASEVPGLNVENIVLLHNEDMMKDEDVIASSVSPPEMEKNFEFKNNDTYLPELDQIIETHSPMNSKEPSNESAEEGQNSTLEFKENIDSSTDVMAVNGNPLIMIYHSHNRESWLPALGLPLDSDPDIYAFDESVNVTLLGKRLEESLKRYQVESISSDVDYRTTITNYEKSESYHYSSKTLEETAVVNPTLNYFIDIHRDAQSRDITTASIEGLEYAKILFIVGEENPNWKENEQIAHEIHEKLESEYPGISRGILPKSSDSGHGEYNQSISPNSILIELGGAYNTLEESYRTVDVLAEIVAEMIWQAELVYAQGSS